MFAFSVQIRMEEEHLQRIHGSGYDRHRAGVPRWIGLPRNSGGRSQPTLWITGKPEPDASILPDFAASCGLTWPGLRQAGT
jgi:hypothetical protein